MSYSITVNTYNNDKKITLSLHNSELAIIEDETNTENKQVFKLDSIYCVKHDHEVLNIHIATKSVSQATLEKASNNIRPEDIKWNLVHLKYKTNNITAAANVTQIDDFVTELSSQSVPHQEKLAKTKVFVILNPTSGSQMSDTRYKDTVRPMLVTAGFTESNISKITTEKNGKTRELAEALGQRISTLADDESVPIIITMGGDGTIYDVVNGLMDASNKKETSYRLGVIPVGSGNAFCLGLNIESVEHATLRIIKAQEEKSFYLMDIKFGHSEKEQDWQNDIQFDASRKPIRLLVVTSWGFHAQIVSKARYLRYFMGNKRFSLVAGFLLKFLKQYEGELVLRQSQKYDAKIGEFEHQQDPVYIKDTQFTYFIVVKQPSLEKGFNIAPFASPLTEDMDVVLLRGADSDTLLKTSMEAFQGGAHVKSNHVEYFKAKELLLRVEHRAELCLDGEIHDLPAKGIVALKVIGSSTLESNITVFV